MGIVVLLLGISGFCIYKMFRPIFKSFFIVAMLMLIIAVGIAAIKDGLGIDDDVQTIEQTEIIVHKEDLTFVE